MFGYYKNYTIRYTGGILDTELVVPTRIRAADTPLLYIIGEGVGRLCGPVPAVITIPP